MSRVALLIVFGSSAGQVIAAPSPTDQAAAPADTLVPATPEAAGLDLLQCIMPILAAVAVAIVIRRGWHRLEPERQGPAAFTPLLGFALLLLLIVLGQLAASLAGHWLGLIGADTSLEERSLKQECQVRLAVYGAQAIGLAAYFAVRRRSARGESRGRRAGARRLVLTGIGAMLLSWPIVATVETIVVVVVQQVQGEAPDPIAHRTLLLMMERPPDVWLILTLLLVVLAAPVFEEVMYRGLLQESLIGAGMDRWVGVVMASGLFALMHYGAVTPHALPALFVLSVCFGVAYERTGSLLAPIVMHATFNAANLALAWLVVS